MRLVIALTVALSLCWAAFLIPVATSADSSTAVIAMDQYLLVGQLPNQVASGDTTRNSTVLWARSSNPGPIVFFVSTEPSFTHPGLVHTVQSEVREITQPVKAQVNGLRPGTEYFYRVVDSGLRQSTGRFVTSAKQNTFAGLRFGVSGDWRGELAPYPSLANADDRQLDFFVALGDTIYADVSSPAVPKSQAETLEEYRAKQNEVYSEILGLNTLGDLRASTSILATIDDHEVTNDFAGGALASSDPRFAQFGNVLINDTPLFDNGLQAFQEYNPVSDEFYGKSDDPRTTAERKLYRFMTYGKDAAVFLLDARSFRDRELTPANPLNPLDVARFLTESFNPGRTMLSVQQLQDLEDDLLRAQEQRITWKFVIVPEPIQNLGPLGAQDRFEGYAAERTRLLKFITEHEIQNVVFVCADIHGTVVNNLTYQEVPFGPQFSTGAWEISTGAVAFNRPFGPTVVNIAAAMGLIIPAQRAFYDSLPVAGDPDDIPNDKDDFLKSLINPQLLSLGYDPLGLNGSTINATLLQGDYIATHSYGWTEFRIDRDSQQLLVTTFGIAPYSRAELLADPPAIISRVPQVVSQFAVTPAAIQP